MNRKSFIILICFAITAMAGAVIPAEAFADEQVFVPGYHEIRKDIKVVPGTKKGLRLNSGVIELYDTRYEDWRQGIKVKDQSNSGLCWAFAATSAAEISYAKEMYGTDSAVREASPGHLGFFLYNRLNDPLGNTKGDINKAWGSTSDDWTSVGGVASFAMQHLATWSGVGPETHTPFTKIANSLINPTGMNYVVPEDFMYDDIYAYDDDCILENGIYFDDPDEQTVKDLIYTYGACAASIYGEKEYFTENVELGVNFYNPDQDSSTNHAVTVVGWDNDYPKENFVTKDKNGATARPERDGAWIVQDSYGTGAHQNGYFYVSYESSGITGKPVVAYDMQPAGTYDYNYQYDGTATDIDTSNEHLPQTVAGSSAANVFTAQSNIVLRAVGISEYNLGETNYTIDIYTGLTDDTDPESGELVCTTRGSTDTPGCKTIRLSKPVGIDEGDRYSIVINFDTDTYFGVEASNFYGFVNVQAAIEPGQSFYRGSADEAWQDINVYEHRIIKEGIPHLYRSNLCFRIKGFADEAKICKVTFTDGCGTVLSEEQVLERHAAAPPEEPEREGYKFAGWDADFDEVTDDMEINAVWEKAYDLELHGTYGGSIEVYSDSAAAGEKVRIVATGDAGYRTSLGSITITTVSGDEIPFNTADIECKAAGMDSLSTVITFIMPKEAVVVRLKFVKRPANTMTAKGKKVSIRKSALKKTYSIKRSKAITVSKAKGDVSYKLLSVSKSKKYFKVASSTGKITIKKGLKKGRYKLKIRVKAEGTRTYLPKVKPVTVTITVK